MRAIVSRLIGGLLFAAAAAATTATDNTASAAEIKVLSAGAMKSVLVEMLQRFEPSRGHKVTFATDTAGGLGKRIEGGEAFDVALITPVVIDRLIAAGKMAPGSRVDLARVGMGVAVRSGAPKPDITSVEKFKAALLAAGSVTYVDPKAGGTSGIYFDRLIDRLGIGEPVRAKARPMPGGYVAELVAKGEVEMAVHQISEIVPVAGVTLVGPLPAEIQSSTIYSAGLAASPREPEAARALIAYLSGPEAKPVLEAKGMEKP